MVSFCFLPAPSQWFPPVSSLPLVSGFLLFPPCPSQWFPCVSSLLYCSEREVEKTIPAIPSWIQSNNKKTWKGKVWKPFGILGAKLPDFSSQGFSWFNFCFTVYNLVLSPIRLVTRSKNITFSFPYSIWRCIFFVTEHCHELFPFLFLNTLRQKVWTFRSKLRIPKSKLWFSCNFSSVLWPCYWGRTLILVQTVL